MKTDLKQAEIYTSFEGLNELKADAGSHVAGTLDEVAKQFESVFLQMIMSNARNGDKVFESDLLKSNQSDFYTDFHDKQLALQMSQSGIGLAEKIKEQMAKNLPPEEQKEISAQQQAFHARSDQAPATTKMPSTQWLTDQAKSLLEKKKEFVSQIWDDAKVVADRLGLDPKVLVAQAALETGWGQRMISDGGKNSYNLFRIKASQWKGDVAQTTTTEFRNGKFQKEQGNFRSYKSYGESMADYENFLRGNPRYKAALNATENSTQFTKELQRAGYATDPNYSNKINQIMNDEVFQQL